MNIDKHKNEKFKKLYVDGVQHTLEGQEGKEYGIISHAYILILAGKNSPDFNVSYEVRKGNINGKVEDTGTIPRGQEVDFKKIVSNNGHALSFVVTTDATAS